MVRSKYRELQANLLYNYGDYDVAKDELLKGFDDAQRYRRIANTMDLGRVLKPYNMRPSLRWLQNCLQEFGGANQFNHKKFVDTVLPSRPEPKLYRQYGNSGGATFAFERSTGPANFRQWASKQRFQKPRAKRAAGAGARLVPLQQPSAAVAAEHQQQLQQQQQQQQQQHALQATRSSPTPPGVERALPFEAASNDVNNTKYVDFRLYQVGVITLSSVNHYSLLASLSLPHTHSLTRALFLSFLTFPYFPYLPCPYLTLPFLTFLPFLFLALSGWQWHYSGDADAQRRRRLPRHA
jgi:hypothetical protein